MAKASLYSVYIERLDSISFSKLQEKFNLSVSWYRFSENYWILYTTSDAEKWFARLSPFVKETGTLFISKIDLADTNGWADTEFWEWFQERLKSALG